LPNPMGGNFPGRMAVGSHLLSLMNKKMFRCGTLCYSNFHQMSCCSSIK